MTLASSLGRANRRRVTLFAVAAYAAMASAMPVPAAQAAKGQTHAMSALSDGARHALREHPLRTLDGHEMTLGSMQGQVVVLNFWASWCAPCRRELPRLGRLQSELASSGVRVIVVSIDENVDNVRRFCTARGITLPVVHDGPDGLARALDLPHIPFTLILDRAGSIAYTTSGSDDASVALVASAARRLIAQPPTADAAEAR